LLVEKRDDWWGRSIEFGVAENPQGPFQHVGSVPESLKCLPAACNTYFASWIPWTDGAGRHIWSISHNRWNGSETVSHLSTYRPTFHTIDLSSTADSPLPIDEVELGGGRGGNFEDKS
jgi:hypothetical protein